MTEKQEQRERDQAARDKIAEGDQRARDQQVAHDARDRQARGRPGVGEQTGVGGTPGVPVGYVRDPVNPAGGPLPNAYPLRAPLEPIGADSPLVAPHVEALAQRDVNTTAEIERQKVTQGGAYQKLADCDAVVQVFTIEAAAARDRLTAALEARKSAFEEVSKLGPIPAIFPADVLAPGEPQVLMFFPRPVTLNDRGRTGSFSAGIHAVPERLANHQYLIDNGVRPYSG